MIEPLSDVSVRNLVESNIETSFVKAGMSPSLNLTYLIVFGGAAGATLVKTLRLGY